MRLLCLFSLLGVLLPCLNAGLDSITPSAPVKDFRFPKFGANGYTQWVLQGAKGIYDGPEQIRVEEMGLRVYTGDERMAVELSLDSPAAALRMEENRAESSESIRIAGANFEITGKGWTWDGAKKDIVVSSEAQVEFGQSILEGSGSEAEAAAGKTLVRSESLELKTTVEDYAFDFKGGVEAESGGLRLWSNRLLARADTPAGESGDAGSVSGELRALRDLLAEGSVVVEEGGRRLKAERARFFPGTEVVELNGSVQVESGGALINGERILSEANTVVVTGAADAGRAQMVLVQAGGLGLSGASSLSEVTLIHADRIVMEELETATEFEFEGRVEIFSGTLTLRAEHLTVFSAPAKAVRSKGEDALPVGEVRELYARGSVYIEDEGMEVQAEEARFYPGRERAKLKGNPRLSHEGAVVSGARMELAPEKAFVYGDGERRVRVLLPELPNLGYEHAVAPEGETEVAEAEAQAQVEVEAEATLIESEQLEMREVEGQQQYIFEDAVSVTGTNLAVTCDRMEVQARRKDAERAGESGLMGATQIEEIVGTGSVRIEQEGRVARADKAWIDPVGSRLVLEGNAEVDDVKGQVRGGRLVLNQGERRAIVEGGADGERARVTLPELPLRKD